MPSDICCKKSLIDKKTYGEVMTHLTELESRGETLHFKEGQILFYKNHIPYGFFQLKKGKVTLANSVLETLSVGTDPDQLLLIGLNHLLSKTPYCATCTAKTEVEVLFVPKSVILPLFPPPTEASV